MALFPPELIAGVLVAFLQVRLRAFFSIASWLVNGLSFFLPPDDELIHTMNGGPPPAPPTGKRKHDTPRPSPTPLSPAERMQQFYIKVAKTEHGVFQQTLFFELFEIMVILVTSILVSCACSDIFAYVRAWHATPEMASARTIEISAYGLVSSLIVSIWFPVTVKFAQGLLATDEAKLGLGVGLVGFVVAMFAIFAPKQLLDFDVEDAVDLTGRRIAIVLRAVGFQDGDFANVSPIAETLRIVVIVLVALVAAAYVSTSFLAAFRFARMYTEMVQDTQTRVLHKIFLHLNVILPLLVAVCWIKPLSTDLIVPTTLVPCSPRSLTRDCVQGPAPFVSTSWTTLTESQWHAMRVYIVLLTIVVRLVTFRSHIQFFLVEIKESIVQLVRRPGPVDGPLLQAKIKIQFNYVPIIAIQYLAPVGAILSALVLLMRQTATSIGIFDAVAWVLLRSGLLTAPPAPGLAWFTAPTTLLPDPSMVPDLGGFHLGDDMTQERLVQVIKGMTHMVIVTPSAHASLFGFLLWWFTFTWFVMTLIGLVYWKNVPHGATSDQELSLRSTRANRETPKLLKNQLKALKVKKH